VSSPDIDSRFVTLRTGPVIPVVALRLAWRLEDEGFTFGLTPQGELWIAPYDRLTEPDRVDLRRWRHHLRALLHHFETTPMDAHLHLSTDAAPSAPERRAS
jgi:hypothetical protein